MTSFSVKEGNCAALSAGAATRLPSTPYDTPCASDHNNPEFHVDRTHPAGRVIEQTKTALRIYIYIYRSHSFSLNCKDLMTSLLHSLRNNYSSRVHACACSVKWRKLITLVAEVVQVEVEERSGWTTCEYTKVAFSQGCQWLVAEV